MKRNAKNGQYIKSAKYVDKSCENCGISFQVKQNDLKYGRGKCCSRKCVDENKKKTYLAEKNPMFGKEQSEKSKQLKSQSLKKLWETAEFRNKIKESQVSFFKRAAIDGTWDRAKKKREQTLLNKIGKKHNWIGVYGKRECDKTFIKKYGMASHLYRNTFLQTFDTSIELIVESILNENKIENIKQFNLFGYSFDFCLPVYKMMIECDGDYWHGYGLEDIELNETQRHSRYNDKIKNKKALGSGYTLIRFWEHEIKTEGFDKQLLNTIYGKN
jgi:very-short-patch-repair endonuclease